METWLLENLKLHIWFTFSSVQSLSSVQFSCSGVSDTSRPHEPQHARHPCPSPTPRVHPNPCPLTGDVIQPSHPLSSPSPPDLDSLQPHEPEHTRPPCPSPTPGVYLNSRPLSRWWHPTISSSVVPFSSCSQSFPTSGSFKMSQLFTSGGQSIGVSPSTSVLPMNTQDWSPLGWTGWISLQSKGLSRVFSNTTVQKHQFFGAQLSSQSNSHIHTWLLEKPQPSLDGPLLRK